MTFMIVFGTAIDLLRLKGYRDADSGPQVQPCLLYSREESCEEVEFHVFFQSAMVLD